MTTELCTCYGMNPSCSRCDGRGYYEPEVRLASPQLIALASNDGRAERKFFRVEDLDDPELMSAIFAALARLPARGAPPTIICGVVVPAPRWSPREGSPYCAFAVQATVMAQHRRDEHGLEAPGWINNLTDDRLPAVYEEALTVLFGREALRRRWSLPLLCPECATWRENLVEHRRAHD